MNESEITHPIPWWSTGDSDTFPARGVPNGVTLGENCQYDNVVLLLSGVDNRYGVSYSDCKSFLRACFFPPKKIHLESLGFRTEVYCILSRSVNANTNVSECS